MDRQTDLPSWSGVGSNTPGCCGAAAIHLSVPAPRGYPCGPWHWAMAPISEGLGTPGWVHPLSMQPLCPPLMHPLSSAPC